MPIVHAQQPKTQVDFLGNLSQPCKQPPSLGLRGFVTRFAVYTPGSVRKVSTHLASGALALGDMCPQGRPVHTRRPLKPPVFLARSLTRTA